MTTEPPVAIGDTVAGKYRIVGLLGAGGMGIVVQAEHLGLGQMVALKFLRAGTSADVSAAERFLREARAAVRIRSEHVARVLDVGRLDDGTPFMVMEYLEGRDLGQVIASDAPVPIATAIGYILQACEALAEAHVAGLVHRDLKPTNIFVTSRADGSPLVKVLDFGISKAATTGSGAVAEVALTTTGVILGSPLYMSPEQLRSTRAVDTRTDIWSLGIVLHELLTSRHAFEADSMPTLCAMIAADPPKPLRSLRPDAPAGLEDVITRCLQKEPSDRFATVADFARALLPFAGPEGLVSVDRIVRVMVGSSATAVSPTLVAPPRRGARTLARRRGLGVAVVLLAALVGGALAVHFPSRASENRGASNGAVVQPVAPFRASVSVEAASPTASDARPSPSTVAPLAVAPAPFAPLGSPLAPSRPPKGRPAPPVTSTSPLSPTSAPASSTPAHVTGEPLDPLVDQR